VEVNLMTSTARGVSADAGAAVELLGAAGVEQQRQGSDGRLAVEVLRRRRGA